MKEKLQNWLKNKENKLLLVLVIFAFAIRFYYFILTKNQPLWWDEADYINMAKHWAFGLFYEFLAVRPILFSIILVPLLKIADNEFLPRLLMNLVSLAAVIGTYYLGKEIYDHRVGLLAGFFMSVFSFGLFFSERLLVDIPSQAFFILSALFFYLYFKKNTPKYIYIAAIISGIGTLVRIQTALVLFVILIYVFTTEKLNFIKKKEYWFSALIFLLILAPYIIWGYFQFNAFVITEAGKLNAAQSNVIATGLGVLKVYVTNFPNYLFAVTDPAIGIFCLIFIFFLVIAYSFKLVLCFDLLLKNKEESLKKNFYLLLLFLIPLILTSMLIAHNEDRYILNAFPALFIILGYFTILAFSFIKNKNNSLAPIALLVFMLIIGYIQLSAADSLIKYKLDSYSQVKDAGIFLAQISDKKDVTISNSMLQIEAYSERKVMSIPGKKEDFEALVKKENPKFFIVSAFEKIPEWVNPYISEKNMTPINAFFIDPAKTQPVVIVYKFD